MIEIFRTSVNDELESQRIIALLQSTQPNLKVNFDLEDPDKILRVEGYPMDLQIINDTLKKHGHQIEII